MTSFERLRAALGVAGHSQALLSRPETLAALGCFEMPIEDWPVSNPFVAVPALLCLGPDDAVLVVAEIAHCRAGVVARDVDRKVRELLAEHGPTYAHHTGHRVGAAWSEEPRITPHSGERLEEGMVLALEPAIYQPGWGGIRLEHTFLVGTSGNEILTQFEHTL